MITKQDLFDFLKKKQVKEPFSEREFSCTRDGLTIRGTEYRPAGDHLPVAIVSHGFMANQDTVKEYTKVLARMGYAAYCYDFCGGSAPGTGLSDGASTDMSVLSEVKDLEAVIAYARSLPYTSDTLLLMGCSQGGFVSALTAAKPEHKVDKLVLFYPALCIPDDAKAGRMMFAKFDPNDIPEVINCGPMVLGRCYASDVIHMDPYKEISPYSGSVLIVHGTDDKIVDITYARNAEKAYDASTPGRTKLVIIEDGAHGFLPVHDAIAIDTLKNFAE